MESRGSYIYSPLNQNIDEIRLLSLFPGSSSDQVCCELHVVSLAADPTYEALSYTWGSPADRYSVHIHNQISNVTENLYFALRRLRRPTGEPRMLWVDALCINQDDIPERNHQVSRMRDIYAQAQDVIVWLGEFKSFQEDSDAAISEAFATLGQLREHRHPSSIQTFAPLLTSAASSQAPSHPDALSALMLLLRNEYWGRAWTVQETVVARHATVLCGGTTSHLDSIIQAAEQYKNHITTECCSNAYFAPPHGIHDALNAAFTLIRPLGSTRAHYRLGVASPSTLLDLLTLYRRRKSTDPRDKVFAFVGIVGQWLPGERVAIDYSLSTEALFKSVALNIVSSMQDLSLFTVGSSWANNSKLPSWAPDWAGGDDCDADLEESLLWQMFFSATGPTRVQPVTYGDDILGVWGVQIGSVSAAHQRRATVLQTMRSWYAHAVTARQATSVAQSALEDAFLRTIRGDFITPLKSPSSFGDRMPYRRATAADVALLKSPLHGSGTEEDFEARLAAAEPAERQIWASFAGATRKRAFFLTAAADVGIGPDTVLVGDEIWVLLGSAVPFVLRRYSESLTTLEADLHSIVGPCYLHDIMDGEAVMQGDCLRSDLDLELVGLV